MRHLGEVPIAGTWGKVPIPGTWGEVPMAGTWGEVPVGEAAMGEWPQGG